MQLLTIYLSCWLLMDLEHEKWLGIQNFNGATDLKRFPGSSREKHTMHNFFAGIITFPSPMRIAREDARAIVHDCSEGTLDERERSAEWWEMYFSDPHTLFHTIEKNELTHREHLKEDEKEYH